LLSQRFGRRVPVRLQLTQTECGAACLAIILSYYGRDTRVAEIRDELRLGRDRLTALNITEAERRGLRWGLPLNVETPGLMTGLAGIGYGLLRLADPEQIPCLLLLEPPNS